MRAAGVLTPFHYVPLHSAPAGRRFARACGDLRVTDSISARLVRLPMFWALGEDDMDHAISTARGWLCQPAVA
jgi:dTDP-4-amino-4,6-dideoxygalactose transaminase